MSATRHVKLRGDYPHSETLAAGQTIVPGEPFERKLLDLKDAGDKRLLDEGALIDSAPAQEKATDDDKGGDA